MPTKIIGFGHYKQSGKSSICDTISLMFSDRIVPLGVDVRIVHDRTYRRVKIYSFADKLKHFCIDVLGLRYEQCYGTDEEKQSLTDIKWEEIPGISTKLVVSETEIGYYDKEFNVQFHSPGYMTAREVLQVFGTGICRRMVNNCWVDATMRQIKQDNCDIALIADMRFPNEADAIKQAGGTTVKFLRRPFPDDNHPSEISLDGYDFDFTFDNREWTMQQKNEEVINTLIDAGILP